MPTMTIALTMRSTNDLGTLLKNIVFKICLNSAAYNAKIVAWAFLLSEYVTTEDAVYQSATSVGLQAKDNARCVTKVPDGKK